MHSFNSHDANEEKHSQPLFYQQEESEEAIQNRKALETKDKNLVDKITKYSTNPRWYVKGEASDKFTKRLARQFDKFSSYNKAFIEIATKISDKLNPKHYANMLEYFISKGSAGVVVAKKIMEYTIEQSQGPSIPSLPPEAKQDTPLIALNGKEKLDRTLMIAAKLGDGALYDKAYHGGADLFRDNKLVTDETGKNILHYACQSNNAKLVKRIAEDLEINSESFEIPNGSNTKDRFDPFKIRNDIAMGKRSLNHLRPLHFISPRLAKDLDEEYGLGSDARPGTFSSAVKYYRIKNKVLGGGVLAWMGGKLGRHHHSVEYAALGGKALAGIPVANIADHAPNMAMNLVESGIFVSIAAAAYGGTLAVRTVRAQKKALKRTGATKDIYLRIDKNAGYNDRTDSNHDLIQALKFRDHQKVYDIITTGKFKNTTDEIIYLLRQTRFDEKAINELFAGTHVNFSSFMIEVFIGLINKTTFADVEYCDKLMDILYRREENAIALTVINNFPFRPLLQSWKARFENQQSEAPHESAQSQEKELIKAFHKYDYYKIQHIIVNGHFDHTSSKILSALEDMCELPNEALPGKKQHGNFIRVVYEDLAKKANHKKLYRLLNDLTYNLGLPQITVVILSNLIQQLDRVALTEEEKIQDKKKLITCALFAARLGDTLLLTLAINILKKHHQLNILDIVDKEGSNILHYAAYAQNSSMTKYILEHTDIINDFHFVTHARKQDKALKVSLRTAKNLMEMPNKNGQTPLKILKNKEALEDLDHFFGDTVGFRQNSNEHLYNQAQLHQERLGLAADVTTLLIALGVCCSWGVPGAILAGKTMGSILAAATIHVAPNISFGAGLSEGLFAVAAAKLTEKKAMPVVSALFKGLDKHISKAFNRDYMRVNPDYDDRIISFYKLLITILANKLSNVVGNHSLLHIRSTLVETTKEFVDSYDDPAKKSLASLACMKMSHMLEEALKDTPIYDLDITSKIKAAFNREANTVEKSTQPASLIKNLESMQSALYESLELANTGSFRSCKPDLKKMNRKLDRFIHTLEQLKEEVCVPINKVVGDEFREENPQISDKEIFIKVAKSKIEQDRQRQLKVNGPSPELSEEYINRLEYITKLANSYEKAVRYRQEHIYAVRYANNNTDKVKKHFLEELHEIEGGIFDGPLTKACKKLIFDPHLFRDQGTLEFALNAAYSKLQHPQPAKAIAMRQAMLSYFDKLEFIGSPAKVERSQQILPGSSAIAGMIGTFGSLNHGGGVTQPSDRTHTNLSNRSG